MDTDERLFDLALRLTDGIPLGDVDTAALTAEQAALVERLRQLEAMSRLHQTDVASMVHDSIRAGADPSGDTPLTWGPLEIAEKVGRGAYGDVYRAWDTRLGREVALKLLRGNNPEDLSFFHEARALASVRHPSVVTVYGAEQIAGRTGIWMEFIRGKTLREIVEESGCLPDAEVRTIGIALCDALSAVHAAGLTHRDIKAQNVMRSNSGQTVLMDFGTSTATMGDATPTPGTPLYMAPEVLVGKQGGTESEIYSLGVLLTYLISGSLPVMGHSLADIRAAHERRHTMRRRPWRFGTLPDVIAKAIEPDPQNRYRSMRAFQDALRRSRHLTIRQFVLDLAAVVIVALILGFATRALDASRTAVRARELKAQAELLLYYTQASIVYQDVHASTRAVAALLEAADVTRVCLYTARELFTGLPAGSCEQEQPTLVGASGAHLFVAASDDRFRTTSTVVVTANRQATRPPIAVWLVVLGGALAARRLIRVGATES